MGSKELTAGIELAKLALQIYFIAAQKAGLSEEEQELMFMQRQEYFRDHPPETLQDPVVEGE